MSRKSTDKKLPPEEIKQVFYYSSKGFGFAMIGRHFKVCRRTIARYIHGRNKL